MLMQKIKKVQKLMIATFEHKVPTFATWGGVWRQAGTILSCFCPKGSVDIQKKMDRIAWWLLLEHF